VTYSKIAEKITELSGNPQEQLTKLRSKAESIFDGGDVSLQNALDIANASLSYVVHHFVNLCICCVTN
jgi:hypothetical protein